MRRRFALCGMLFMLCAAVYAQDRSKLSVYVPLPEGGTAQQKEYFQTNFKMELIGANYPSVETRAESAYTLLLTIQDNPDFVPTAATDGVTSWDDNQLKPFELGIKLVHSDNDDEVVSFSFLFDKIESMNEWNLYLLYQALANAYAGDDGAPPPPPPVDDRWRNQWFYLNLNAGVDAAFYTSDKWQIHTAVVMPLLLAGAEWHFLDFLSAEADLKMRLLQDGKNFVITPTVAVMPKVVLKFGVLMLEVYSGLEYAHSLSTPVPPLSWIAGTQLGLRIKPQSAFVLDVGLTKNLMGKFRAEDNKDYDVWRLHVMLGVKIGFKDRKPADTKVEGETAEGEQ